MTLTLTDILLDTMDRLGDAELAGIVGTDGLSVEMVVSEDSPYEDIELLELELAGLASASNATSMRLGTGPVLDLIIESDYLTYLISLITSGYYAVLGIQPEGNIGRARFLIRQLVNRLQTEL